MTAEFWQYDARIGRRWNVDPVVKEYESPYAAFGNNPIWNVDPDGSDTTKYLSNKQLVDALKIGTEAVRSKIDAKVYNKYFGEEVTASLKEKSQAYWKAHQSEMNFGAYQEFESSVIGYHYAVANIAQWEGVDEFSKLERSVIYNKGVSNELTIDITIGRFRQAETRWWAVWGLSVQSVGIVATGGLGARPGVGPRGPQITSARQQEIVNAGIRKSVPTNIHAGQQGKHIVGHNNYQVGKSILTADAQTLLKEFHAGEATILRQPNANRVIVDFNRPIGTYINPEGVSMSTTRGTINFGKSGAHIVPSNPK